MLLKGETSISNSSGEVSHTGCLLANKANTPMVSCCTTGLIDSFFFLPRFELPIRPDFVGATLAIPPGQNVELRCDDGRLSLALK